MRTKDFVPDGYDAENNPLVGSGGYISSIGRDIQLPPVAAELKRAVETGGGHMTMELIWDKRNQYVGYRLIARNKAGEKLRALDVTGAASRFPPWELMDAKKIDEQRKRYNEASDLDAPPESGNFDGGYVASATQAARYARHVSETKGSTP